MSETHTTTREAGGATALAEPPTQTAPAPRVEAKFGYWWGTGRRKAAVARVRVRPGEGKFLVNDRPFDQFFTEVRDRFDVSEPLDVTKTKGKVDVLATVEGGGYTGQAGAIRLGISRALMRYDSSLEAVLREHSMLSRDPRRVERKKYGQPGARRRFQFSKR